MSCKAKSPCMQINLGDRFHTLSKRGYYAVRNNHLGHFGDEIFLKSTQMTLWCYIANVTVGSLIARVCMYYIVMIMFDLTADELILRIDSDIALQYALHSTSLDK